VRARPFAAGSRILLATLSSAVIAGCSPTQPTAVVQRTDPPALACPASATVESTDGAIPVTYADPVVTGGQSPVTLNCTPVSGATYAAGTTPVVCTVTDAQHRTSSCTFAVTVVVLPKPQLSVTKFLAFGDSITAGEVPDPTDTPLGVIRPRVVRQDLAYPQQLLMLLQQRYPTQMISVINDGLSGERAVQGVARLPGDLSTYTPDVLLLLEGVNDVDQGESDPSAPAAALDALRTMIRTAIGRGVRVIVGTLLPELTTFPFTRASAPELIGPFNGNLTAMALSEGASVVDLYTPFKTDLADWISPLDGLHPTPAGYQEMAQLFFTQIRTMFEQPAALSPARKGWSAMPGAAGQGSRSGAAARPTVRGSAAPSRGKTR
jgi:lysophospholipase L1-like esterase